MKNVFQLARAAGLASLVITFEPQPMEFFRPEQAPPRLTRLREKLEAMKPATRRKPRKTT